jgi:MFS family permease
MTSDGGTPATSEATRRQSLWRHRDFMKLWTGETISQFGTQVSALAIPLIAALILHVTPFEFGLLATVEFLPFILISLPAGVWVDRMRRRPILIAGDLGRAVALLSIPIAAAVGALTIWQLYLVGFITGCLTVFFDVAYQSYLPALVDREDILEGNSKLEISRSAAQITGPGIAGFLIGVISAPAAILVDSLSFIGSAFFLWRIKKFEPVPEPRVDAQGKRAGMRTEIGEGLRWVLGSRYLRAIAACTGTSNLFGNIGFAMILLYAVTAITAGGLGLDAQQIGIVLSVGSVGALVGAVTADRIGRRLGVGPTIIATAATFGLPMLLIAVATPESAIVLGSVSMFIATFGGVVYNINQVSFRQAITPERMQGRMNATMRFIVWGTIPVGNILGGILGGTIGLHATLWVSAVLSFIPVLPVLFSPVRTIREMPAPITNEEESLIVGEALDETARPALSPKARLEDDVEAGA